MTPVGLAARHSALSVRSAKPLLASAAIHCDWLTVNSAVSTPAGGMLCGVKGLHTKTFTFIWWRLKSTKDKKQMYLKKIKYFNSKVTYFSTWHWYCWMDIVVQQWLLITQDKVPAVVWTSANTDAWSAALCSASCWRDSLSAPIRHISFLLRRERWISPYIWVCLQCGNTGRLADEVW